MKMSTYFKGLSCEECHKTYSRTPTYRWEGELFLYKDLRGITRVFCEMHVPRTGAEKINFGAESMTEILEKEKEQNND